MKNSLKALENVRETKAILEALGGPVSPDGFKTAFPRLGDAFQAMRDAGILHTCPDSGRVFLPMEC